VLRPEETSQVDAAMGVEGIHAVPKIGQDGRRVAADAGPATPEDVYPVS